MRILEEDKFEEEIKDKDIIVQLSADWCGPCKVITPVLQNVAESYNIDVFKVNIDNCPGIVNKYTIRSIPRILFMKSGNVIEDITGLCARQKLEATCKEVYGV